MNDSVQSALEAALEALIMSVPGDRSYAKEQHLSAINSVAHVLANIEDLLRWAKPGWDAHREISFAAQSGFDAKEMDRAHIARLDRRVRKIRRGTFEDEGGRG